MSNAIIAAGRIADPRHIELDEPLVGIEGRVQLVVRIATPTSSPPQIDIMDFIQALPPGTRTKDDIDRQIQDERASWGD